MIYSHKGYPKCYVTEFKLMGRMHENLLSHCQLAQDCEEIAAKFTEEGLLMTVSVHAYYGYTLTVGCQVDSMDDIARILREFGKYNHSQTEKVEENPASQSRKYTLAVVIDLEIQLKGTVCKYVETGKETIEKPIYELRCDEPDNVEEESEAA